jgi:hypothetical protein
MLAVNTPHVLRNITVWNNPLGVPDKYGLANEIITPASIASNVIRNLSIHANSRFETWNKLVYDGVAAVHSVIGIGHDDRRTTYRREHFAVPLKLHDEGVATNPVHLLIIVAAALVAWKRKMRPAFYFLGCVVVGALVFSTYLKWQPWHMRLHMPLFMVSAGAAAAVFEKSIGRPNLRLIAFVLLLFAIPPVFRNGFAPIVSRRPVFMIPYEESLFLHRDQAEALPKAADVIADSGCSRVGLIWEESVEEYPVWNLMRARIDGEIEIRHILVTNETRRMASERDKLFRPCAIISSPGRPYRRAVRDSSDAPVMTHNDYRVWLLPKT